MVHVSLFYVIHYIQCQLLQNLCEYLIIGELKYLLHVFLIVVGFKVFQDFVGVVVFHDGSTLHISSIFFYEQKTWNFNPWNTCHIQHFHKVLVFISCLRVCWKSTLQNTSLKLKGVGGRLLDRGHKCCHSHNIMAFVCITTISYHQDYSTSLFVQPWFFHLKCTY